MPRRARQTCRVNETAEKVLSDNLRWLMGQSSDLNSQAKLAAKAKIDQRTVGRILNSEHMPTLDKISALATAYAVEPWQLLAPGLGSSLYKIDADRRIVPVMATPVQAGAAVASVSGSGATSSSTGASRKRPDWAA